MKSQNLGQLSVWNHDPCIKLGWCRLPSPFLKWFSRMERQDIRQAWWEKLTLNFIKSWRCIHELSLSSLPPKPIYVDMYFNVLDTITMKIKKPQGIFSGAMGAKMWCNRSKFHNGLDFCGVMLIFHDVLFVQVFCHSPKSHRARHIAMAYSASEKKRAGSTGYYMYCTKSIDSSVTHHTSI